MAKTCTAANPRPVGNVQQPDGSLDWHNECRTCGQPLMEAIYSGGWMHQSMEPHPLQAFVYSDGARNENICTACCGDRDDPRHDEYVIAGILPADQIDQIAAAVRDALDR